MGIEYRKREKTAKYNPKQQQRNEELSGKLAKNLYRSSYSVIIDDEKYLTFSGNNMPGNAGYYSSDKSNCPDKSRFVGKEKFPTKILIWIAISVRGMSKPYLPIEIGGHQIRHLHQRMLGQKVAAIHPRA